MPKRGRISQEEIDFIHANRGVYSPEEMAARIDRKPETVRGILAQVGDYHTPDPVAPLKENLPTDGSDIRQSKAWQLLKSEFSPDEIGYFMERWGELIEQFREDVAASEKAQLLMAIKLEILIHRILAAQQKARGQVEKLEKEKADLLEGVGPLKSEWEPDIKARFNDIEALLGEAISASSARSRDMEGLQARHESLLKALKATREQRISRIESRASFLDLIKLLQVEEDREREGRAMELMRLAQEKETQRLGAIHQYADGAVDQPLLNAETVVLLEDAGNDRDVPESAVTGG